MPTLIREKRCQSCGATFGCGPGLSESGQGCWCNDLPSLMARPGGDCFCPACLKAALADEGQAADAPA